LDRVTVPILPTGKVHAMVASDIELEACDAFKRVCYTCCDPVACAQSTSGVDPDLARAMPSCPWKPRP
jgi:hypothetical protein